MEQHVPLPERPRIKIATHSGRLLIVAEARDDLLIESAHGRVATEDEEGWIIVRPGKRPGRVVVRVPEGADLAVGTSSATVTIEGRAGNVRVTSRSGAIRIAEASEVDARCASGSVFIGSCGRCRVQSASGSISIGHAGHAAVATASGKVAIESAGEEVRVRAVSGRVEVTTNGRAGVAAETVSAGVTITLPKGTRPDVKVRSAAGRSRIEVDTGSDCRIRLRSVSGALVVTEREA